MLLIFDCDGVLVDSEIIASQVNLDILKELGVEMTLDEMSEKYAGLPGKEIFVRIGDELDRPLPDDLEERTDQMMDERMIQSLQAVAGVEAMLNQLDSEGLPRCICSNSRTERLKRNLAQTNLLHRFDPHIYSSRLVGNKEPKPDPNVFLHALSEFEADPKTSLVVEDSAHGVMGAVAAGLRVVGFTGASHSYPGHAEQLMDAGAITTVNRLSDLPPTFAALKDWSGLL